MLLLVVVCLFVCLFVCPSLIDPDQLELIYVKPKDFSPKPNPRNREITEDPFGATVINNPIYSPGDNTMAREIPNLSMAKQTHLLFRDIDKTSGLDVGWRRINTMEHYFTLYNVSIVYGFIGI